MLNLTQRAPRANPLNRGKSQEKRADFADTEGDPARVSEEGNMMIKQKMPSTEQHRPGSSEHKHVRSSERQRCASLHRQHTSEHRRLGPVDGRRLILPEQLNLGSLGQH